jgi:hypothetical protein
MQKAHALGSSSLKSHGTSASNGNFGSGLADRFAQGQGRIHRSKCRICHVLGTLSKVRTDFRISLLLDHFKQALQNGTSLAGHASYDSKKTGDEQSGAFVPLDEPGSEGRRMKNIRPPTLDLEGGLNIDFSLSKLASVAETGLARIESSVEAAALGQDKMGKTIDGKPDDWALTTKALEILVGGMNQAENKGLFGDLSKKLDLAAMGGGRTDLVTACIDLLMYESAELFDMAFCALTNNFRQERNFLRALEDTQLLVKEDTVDVYTKLQSELSHFRHHIQSYELWGRVSKFNNEVDMNNVESIKKMLIWMRCECTSEGGAIDGSEPETEIQMLLGNLDVHEIVLEALEIDMDMHSNDLDAHLLEIKELCCTFLEKFVMANTANQNRLFPFLEEKFMPLCATGLAIAPAIAALFVNNRPNCVQLSNSPVILNQFGQALKDGGTGHPSGLGLLECFGKLIAPNGLPLAENQNAILRVMTKKEWNPTLDPREALCMTLITAGGEAGSDDELSGSTKIAMDYRKELMRNFDSSLIMRSGELHPSMAHAAQGTDTVRLLYHVNVLNLLTKVCVGKSPTTEIKCQQMLPISAMLDVIEDLSTKTNEPAYGIAGFLVKSSMLDLVREVYFETGISAYDSLGKDERVWGLMRVLTEDLVRFVDLKTSNGLQRQGSSKQEVDAVSNPMSSASTASDSASFVDSVREKMIFGSVLPTISSFCDNYLPMTKYINDMDKVARKLERKLSPAHYSTLRSLQEAIGGLVVSGHLGSNDSPTPRLMALIRCGVAARKYAVGDLEAIDIRQTEAQGGALSMSGTTTHNEADASVALRDLCKALHNSYEFQYRIEDEFARFVETVRIPFLALLPFLVLSLSFSLSLLTGGEYQGPHEP